MPSLKRDCGTKHPQRNDIARPKRFPIMCPVFELWQKLLAKKAIAVATIRKTKLFSAAYKAFLVKNVSENIKNANKRKRAQSNTL